MILFEEKTSQQLEVNMTIFNTNECHVWFETALTTYCLFVQIEATKRSTLVSTKLQVGKNPKEHFLDMMHD
jgi:hypothetical protein